MPKATAYLDHDLRSAEDDVRSSRQSGIVKAIAIAFPEKSLPQYQFGFRVLVAIALHYSAAIRRADTVQAKTPLRLSCGAR